MGLMSFLKEIGFDTFLDFLGFVTNIFYVLTPILFNMLIEYETFEIESISVLAVFSMYCNAFIYFFLNLFAENIGNSFVLRDYCNLIGAFLGLVYLAIYFYERYKDEDFKKIIINYILVVVLTGLIIIFEYFFIISTYNKTFKMMFKWIGVFPNVLEYFPIGLDIFYLIKKRKSKNFLMIGGIFGLLNAIVWFAWTLKTTLMNKDEPQYHSILANTLSISLIMVQFFVFCKYNKNRKNVYFNLGANKYD